jgi:hypothetical protein
MSTTSDIIDRIKKLLRLARSANPHEAQLAMQRAMELAAEHRVTIEGLNPDECAKEKATTHRDTRTFARINYDQRYALAICRLFFCVSTVECQVVRIVDGWPRSAWKSMIVGTPGDIEIAHYVFGFLTQHFAFCWRQFHGRFRNRHAYVHGMFLGLRDKLSEQMPAADTSAAKGNELVLADQKAYIAAVVGKTTSSPLGKPDHEAHAAAFAGYLQGKKTEIRSALKPSTTEQPLALK